MTLFLAIGKFLLGGVQWLAIVAQFLMDFVKRNPWQALSIALVALSAFLWWRGDNIAGQRDRALATVAEMKQASAESLRRAKAQKAAVEHRYRDLAKQKDNEHEKELAHAMDATDRYIASHRVRSCAGSPPRRPAPTTGDNSSGVSERMPAYPVVAVSDSDVRACGAAVVYAVKAHEWATGVQAAISAPLPDSP